MADTQTGVIYCDDNLRRLTQMRGESVDLIYLDPPFFSNRVYEVIWGDEAEVRSFEDRWEGGVQVYIQWMRDRVLEMHRVLKPTGSIYLHCDPTASHYLKVMMDEIFGRQNFRNEIIWRRTGAHGKVKRYAPIHDTILYYTRSKERTWNNPKRPYMVGHVEEYFVKDEHGWRTNYYGNVLTGSGRRGGESGKPWRGFDPSQKNRHWAIPRALLEEVDEDMSELSQHEKLDRLFELGYVKVMPGQAWPIYEHYIDPKRDGVAVADIWAFQPYTSGTVFGTDRGIDEDVRWLSTTDRERLGYPTQKPEALLERIIGASTHRNDVVLDPFCGCGTTIAVAERMHRQWIGLDISPTAVGLMKRRMDKLGAPTPRIVGMPVTADQLKDLRPFEFQNWVIQAMNGAHAPRRVGDMGIDGYSFLEHLPIQVKQSERVGRNVVDNFETAIRRSGKDRGFIVAFSFGKGAHEEVARAKREGLTVTLVTVERLLEDPSDLITPDAAQLWHDLLPPARPKSARPSAEELIASDRAAAV